MKFNYIKYGLNPAAWLFLGLSLNGAQAAPAIVNNPAPLIGGSHELGTFIAKHDNLTLLSLHNNQRDGALLFNGENLTQTMSFTSLKPGSCGSIPINGMQKVLFNAQVSSTENNSSENLSGDNLSDGNFSTRWSSQFSDNQWIYLDNLRTTNGDKINYHIISKIVLHWETAYARDYEIQQRTSPSTDGKFTVYPIADDREWVTIHRQTKTSAGTDEISIPDINQKDLRIKLNARGTPWGFSLKEIELYKLPAGANCGIPTAQNSTCRINNFYGALVSGGGSKTISIDNNWVAFRANHLNGNGLDQNGKVISCSANYIFMFPAGNAATPSYKFNSESLNKYAIMEADPYATILDIATKNNILVYSTTKNKTRIMQFDASAGVNQWKTITVIEASANRIAIDENVIALSFSDQNIIKMYKKTNNALYSSWQEVPSLSISPTANQSHLASGFGRFLAMQNRQLLTISDKALFIYSLEYETNSVYPSLVDTQFNAFPIKPTAVAIDSKFAVITFSDPATGTLKFYEFINSQWKNSVLPGHQPHWQFDSAAISNGKLALGDRTMPRDASSTSKYYHSAGSMYLWQDPSHYIISANREFRIQNFWAFDWWMHIERGTVEASIIDFSWWSARWVFEPTAGGYRIRNVWKPNEYLKLQGSNVVTGPKNFDGSTTDIWDLEFYPWQPTTHEKNRVYFIKNRAWSNVLLNVEYGYLMTTGDKNWWSARWAILPIQ